MLEGLQEKTINCPYCGELISVLIDSSVSVQHYVEDCSVCCQPMELQVFVENGDCRVQAHSDSD